MKFIIAETQEAYNATSQTFIAEVEEMDEEDQAMTHRTHCAKLSAHQIAKFRKMRFPDADLNVTETCQFSGKENAADLYFNA